MTCITTTYYPLTTSITTTYYTLTTSTTTYNDYLRHRLFLPVCVPLLLEKVHNHGWGTSLTIDNCDQASHVSFQAASTGTFIPPLHNSAHHPQCFQPQRSYIGGLRSICTTSQISPSALPTATALSVNTHSFRATQLSFHHLRLSSLLTASVLVSMLCCSLLLLCWQLAAAPRGSQQHRLNLLHSTSGGFGVAEPAPYQLLPLCCCCTRFNWLVVAFVLMQKVPSWHLSCAVSSTQLSPAARPCFAFPLHICTSSGNTF